uniref:acylphosphatase n=1 Tax=Candidatus Methanophagaceae archaeon ANME-1 ERB6 TaxID=2759912 RepID=A0A7G9YRW3_9EURY|nr:acylphosphatase [Methanosarcinales archaeon ANME-1 ERB6]
MTQTRATIIAKGEVQRVGYRAAVEKIARKLKLTVFVENLKPYDVRIVAEGEEDVLNEFVAQIRITRHPIAPISVEDLDVEFGAATKEFEYFAIRRGDWKEELGERMDTAGALLYRSVELGTESVKIGWESVKTGKKMLEKRDSMLGKQDKTIEILEDVREDTGEITNALAFLKEIYRETSELRDKYGVLSRDVEAIKVKLKAG